MSICLTKFDRGKFYKAIIQLQYNQKILIQFLNMSWNKKEDNRINSFNLQRFYEDLNRVQSSLGKKQQRKCSNSPYVRNQLKKYDKDERQKDIAAFKKEIAPKELLKTKIKLSTPYQSTKDNHIEPKNNFYEPRNYQTPELASSTNNQDRYQRVKSKLMSLKKSESKQHKKEEQEGNQELNNKITVNLYQNRLQNSHLQRSFEKPNNQVQEISQFNQKLLTELTKRNAIYKITDQNISLRNNTCQKKGHIDLSLKLQQHFRQYKMMQGIISQLTRICGMNESTDLQILYSFLKQDCSRSMDLFNKTKYYEDSQL